MRARNFSKRLGALAGIFVLALAMVAPCKAGDSVGDSASGSAGGSADARARAAPESATFIKTIPNKKHAPGTAPPGMVWIPGGEFTMGSGVAEVQSACGSPQQMRDARPLHRVYVDGFWMDKTEVTNEQFEKFVNATGYITVAEKTPTQEEFPTAPKENLVAGSTVFTPTNQRVPLNNVFRWWRYQRGADWRHPEGPESNLQGREKEPVVQIAYPDAVAYATWAGKRLPTEAEWEFAARGGRTGSAYVWGNQFQPGKKWMANIYQGEFPVKDLGSDGYVGRAPVAQFPANGYGLYDMAGNVWEWCSDLYRADYYDQLVASGNRVTRNPLGPDSSWDPTEPHVQKRVQRGGSFLCTDQYCTRYMVGSRGRGEPMTGANHLGFRCVRSP